MMSERCNDTSVEVSNKLACYTALDIIALLENRYDMTKSAPVFSPSDSIHLNTEKRRDEGVPRKTEPIFAFFVTALGYCLISLITGLYPFGPVSQQLGDLSGQFVPFIAMLRDIVFGHSGLSDLTWTWTAGMGVPNIGNYVTYLSSPLYLLIGFFPVGYAQFGLWVITLAHIGLAASAMSVLLRKLVPGGRSLWLVTLATCYGLSSWVIGDADYVPMWLGGLIGLPLLVLCGLWANEGKRFVLSVVIVATVWLSNYYTAYMASIGAAILVWMIVASQNTELRKLLSAMFSFFIRGVVGVGLTAVLLVPAFLEVLNVPSDMEGRPVDYPLRTMLAHVLPGIEALSLAPSFYVGTVPLVFAVLFLFEKSYSLLSRVVFGFGVSATILSMSAQPFLLAWHLFDIPNGSPWRSAFVVVAMVVVMAWYGLQGIDSLSFRHFFAPAVALLVICYFTLRSSYLGGIAAFSKWGMASAATSGILIFSLWLCRRKAFLSQTLSLAICLLVFAELILNGAFIEKTLPSRVETFPLRESGLARDFELDDVGWPNYRADVQEFDSVRMPNGGATLTAPALNYYSSTIPAETSVMLRESYRFGAGNRSRIITSPEQDPVGMKLASVSLLISPEGKQTQTAFPTVRRFPDAVPQDDSLPKVFKNRNDLAGMPVYSSPLAVTVGEATEEQGQLHADYKVSCPAGNIVSFDSGSASVRVLTQYEEFTVSNQVWSASSPVREEQFELELGGVENADVTLQDTAQPLAWFVCADIELLEEQILATELPNIRITPGNIAATFDSPADKAIVTTTALDGWVCRVDGKSAATGALHGLLTVELNGSNEFQCTYKNPGLASGALISVVSFLAAVVFAFLNGLRSRKKRGL